MKETKESQPEAPDNDTYKAHRDGSLLIVIGVVLILVFGLIVGLAFAALDGRGIADVAPSPHSVDDHSHSTDDAMAHSHSMMQFAVDSENAPTIDFVVEEDTKSGWNITLTTTNFVFAPENVNEAPVVGEGHAHLYVDDVKIARLYGPYFHYDKNFDGSKVFRVELNANDHSVYAVDGEPIDKEVTVTHSHSE
jgi:hypothetical protein